MILTQQEFDDCLMSGTFNDRRRLSAHNVEMEATRKAHIAVEAEWLLIQIDRDNLRARIAELTDALTAEQERHANMTRLFDESDKAVKEKDARMPTKDEVDFDAWWAEHGRFIDPDTSDVDWFDKRKELCALAFLAARRPVTSQMMGAAIQNAKARHLTRVDGRNNELQAALSPSGEAPKEGKE